MNFNFSCQLKSQLKKILLQKMLWLVKSNVVFYDNISFSVKWKFIYLILINIITQLLQMNLVYFMLVLKECWSTSELRVGFTRCETGLSPPVIYFTDHSKVVLLLWIFHVF